MNNTTYTKVRRATTIGRRKWPDIMDKTLLLIENYKQDRLPSQKLGLGQKVLHVIKPQTQQKKPVPCDSS